MIPYTRTFIIQKKKKRDLIKIKFIVYNFEIMNAWKLGLNDTMMMIMMMMMMKKKKKKNQDL